MINNTYYFIDSLFHKQQCIKNVDQYKYFNKKSATFDKKLNLI